MLLCNLPLLSCTAAIAAAVSALNRRSFALFAAYSLSASALHFGFMHSSVYSVVHEKSCIVIELNAFFNVQIESPKITISITQACPVVNQQIKSH